MGWSGLGHLCAPGARGKITSWTVTVESTINLSLWFPHAPDGVNRNFVTATSRSVAYACFGDRAATTRTPGKPAAESPSSSHRRVMGKRGAAVPRPVRAAAVAAQLQAQRRFLPAQAPMIRLHFKPMAAAGRGA